MTLPKKAWLTLTTAVAANAKASELEIIVFAINEGVATAIESAGWARPGWPIAQEDTMKLIVVKYDGGLPGRTPLRNEWEPGDVKRVPERDAEILLRFAEFHRAEEAEATDRPEDVEAAIAAHAQRENDERNETEAMLMLVDTMDKDALEAYALKYEINLDKHRGLDKAVRS